MCPLNFGEATRKKVHAHMHAKYIRKVKSESELMLLDFFPP